MRKPKERLLLTWNEQKHPEVVEFFNSIEQGLYSHYVREAIKFYMKHKNRIDEKSSPGDYSNSLQVKSTNITTNIPTEEKREDNTNYVEFNPNDL